VVRDENAPLADWNTPAGWGISGAPAGNPNAGNPVFSLQFEGWQRDHFTGPELGLPAVSGPLGDANRDGIVNLLKYAAGIDPWMQTPPAYQPIAEVTGGRLRLHFRRASNAIDLETAAEFGSNLLDWSEVLVPVGPPLDHGDGTETVVFEDDGPPATSRFGRIRVTLLPP